MWFMKTRRDDNMKFGEKLSFLRKQNGMTQMELAEKLDVSRQAVSRWENETAFPSYGNLISISKLFGVSLNVLIDENASIVNEKQEDEGKESHFEKEKTESEYTQGNRVSRFLKRIFLLTITSILVVCLAFCVVGIGSKNKKYQAAQENNLTEQEKVIFSQSWAAEGVDIYVRRRNGVVEKVPEFSELFPGWSIPQTAEKENIDQSADCLIDDNGSVLDEKEGLLSYSYSFSDGIDSLGSSICYND